MNGGLSLQLDVAKIEWLLIALPALGMLVLFVLLFVLFIVFAFLVAFGRQRRLDVAAQRHRMRDFIATV